MSLQEQKRLRIDIPLDPNLRDFNFDAEIISNVFKNLENLTGLVSDSSNKTDFQQLQNFIKSLKERANYTNYDTATKKFPVDYVSKALIK